MKSWKAGRGCEDVLSSYTFRDWQSIPDQNCEEINVEKNAKAPAFGLEVAKAVGE